MCKWGYFGSTDSACGGETSDSAAGKWWYFIKDNESEGESINSFEGVCQKQKEMTWCLYLKCISKP